MCAAVVNGDVKWAIAGRSKSKLEAAKESVAEESGVKEVLELDTILVDTWYENFALASVV